MATESVSKVKAVVNDQLLLFQPVFAKYES